MIKILFMGLTLAVLAWSGTRIWSAGFWVDQMEKIEGAEQAQIGNLRGIMEKMPAYKLTFLGARLFRGGDYEMAEKALEIATQKDRFYPDAFRYYGYVLQALGDPNGSELATRRANSLNPAVGQ